MRLAGRATLPLNTQFHHTIAMIVIVRTGRAEFITAPQDPTRAWELADRLTRETGILHRPYRI